MEISFNRQNHPFKNMTVGQTINIGDAPQIRAYAHVYGQASNKRFKSKKIDGSIFVKRIS
jgi:hypothetical protein